MRSVITNSHVSNGAAENAYSKMFRGLMCWAVLQTIFLFRLVASDTPANCTYDEVVGTWKFFETKRGILERTNCSEIVDPALYKHVQMFELLFPDIAIDSYGNKGKWTMIYNQGFEVVVNGRKYFAFSKWTENEHHVTSYCDQTNPGWAHDTYSRDWSCFYGRKVRRISQQPASIKTHRKMHYMLPFYAEYRYENNRRFVAKINEIQNSWTATEYPEFEELSRLEMLRKLGGPKSHIASRPRPAPITERIYNLARELPEHFDWRNVSGVDYVSPIRDQGACGSCYAFASAAMLESRVRILTDNMYQPVFSPQDIVDCSEYSQGCDGGFPYLIAGKYAEDFGWVAEDCNPYKGVKEDERICLTDEKCKRYYATNYGYVGGFYGATNEPLMRLVLVKNGPIVVGIEAFDDFMHYKGGIYHHTRLKDTANWPRKWNPFELTNHAVLIVGYGVDRPTSTDYWIVKNSWGTKWGENGYFRIRRGTDECSIESLAFEATPIPTY